MFSLIFNIFYFQFTAPSGYRSSTRPLKGRVIKIGPLIIRSTLFFVKYFIFSLTRCTVHLYAHDDVRSNEESSKAARATRSEQAAHVPRCLPSIARPYFVTPNSRHRRSQVRSRSVPKKPKIDAETGLGEPRIDEDPSQIDEKSRKNRS